MPRPTLKTSWIVIVLVALMLGACAGAPVQDMSNARQALAAAEQSGANHAAPREMAEARRLLQAAQAALDQGDFSTARGDAIAARRQALKAQRISMGMGDSGLVPP